MLKRLTQGKRNRVVPGEGNEPVVVALCQSPISIAVNDLSYAIGLRNYPSRTLLFSLNNFIAPPGRSEYGEGQRIWETELDWSYVFGGISLGYRLPVHPFRQDRAVNLFVTYEPGGRGFQAITHSSPQCGVPSDTYEGRVHVRVRTNSMNSNLMELPHEGITIGGDFFYGHRAKWVPWEIFPSKRQIIRKNGHT
ncbi:MAG TPA: hypothetical protein PKD12_03755 [Nitrospira sp.]|nr:hypothetical protein [Nitrospira sp.]